MDEVTAVLFGVAIAAVAYVLMLRVRAWWRSTSEKQPVDNDGGRNAR